MSEQTITVPLAALRVVLSRGTGHGHRVPGVWDDDNRPGVAGQPCTMCAAHEELRALPELQRIPPYERP